MLSLAECSNISDIGIQRLSQLKYLTKLNLLGCVKIEDEGIKTLAK